MVRIFTMDKKTNATRKLDMLKIPYKEYFYSPEDAATGTDVAALIGQNPEHVFKTLVTTGKSNIHYVEIEGAFTFDRIYSRRMFTDRYEKTLPHHNR